MTPAIRAFGWLLLVLGTALGALGFSAVNGLIDLPVESLGIDLDTSAERNPWVLGCLVAAALGLILLLFTKPHREHKHPRVSQSPHRGSGWR